MDASVASPVHTTMGRTTKSYTTSLPNTDIYDMNKSTNKCTSVEVQGRPKTMYQCTLSIFPAKKVEKTEKKPKRPENSQYMTKPAAQMLIFFTLMQKSQILIVKLNLTHFPQYEPITLFLHNSLEFYPFSPSIVS